MTLQILERVLYLVYVAEACCSAGSPWRYTGFLCKVLVFYGQQLNGVRSLEARLYKPHIPHQDLSCGYAQSSCCWEASRKKKTQLAPSLSVHSDFSLYPNYSFFFLYFFLPFISFLLFASFSLSHSFYFLSPLLPPSFPPFLPLFLSSL